MSNARHLTDKTTTTVAVIEEEEEGNTMSNKSIETVLGTMTFGAQVDQNTALSMVQQFLENSNADAVCWLDTAYLYEAGKSELNHWRIAEGDPTTPQREDPYCNKRYAIFSETASECVLQQMPFLNLANP